MTGRQTGQIDNMAVLDKRRMGVFRDRNISIKEIRNLGQQDKMIGSNAIVAVNSGISLNFVGVQEIRITNQEGTIEIKGQAVKEGKRVVTDIIAIIVIVVVRVITGIN